VLVRWTILVLPFDFAIALGGGLGWLTFVTLRSERRKTLKHLAAALGQEIEEREREAIARRVFINGGRFMAETTLFPRWTEERLRQRIRMDNTESLLEAVRAGKGLVLFTGHFGNWELMGAYAVRVLGIDLGVIARRLSNPHIDRMTNNNRRRIGIKVFLRGERATQFLGHLRDGGALALLGDQDIRHFKGIFVDFFGMPAHTLTGPAELVIHTGVPWFFAVMVRSKDGLTHRILCEGPFSAPEGKNREEQVRRLTEQYTGMMERAIREYPDQWMWIHNRWKRQPGDEQSQ
jgi:KDO2-lipid IV(A) lauroyltransferase